MDSRNDPHPKLCAKLDYSDAVKWDFDCEPPVTGSWVKITKEKVTKRDDVLTMCEVMVIGARPGILLIIAVDLNCVAFM